MALHKHLLVILLACLINSCYAYPFYVGGSAGWVPNPSENYNHWAERMRFQVNDTLVFEYKKGSNSVLVVNKDDYDKCNTNKPIKKMDDGNSIFKFDHSGPFFFISGNKNDCEKGSQKLIIVVLAIRTPPSSPTPIIPTPSTPGKSPATSPATSPVVSPPVSQTPASSPVNAPSPATSPVSQTPTSSPGNAPSPASSPATSPASSTSPESAPTPATSPENAPTPATFPATSPAPSGAIISPSPSSGSSSSSSPSSSPGNSPPGSVAPAGGGNSPTGSVAPAGGGGNSPPADIQSPTGSKNSAVKAFTTTTTVLVSIIFTIIISA